MTQNDIECHLQSLAQSMSEFRQSVQWTELKITDNIVKTKVTACGWAWFHCFACSNKYVMYDAVVSVVSISLPKLGSC